MLKAYDAVCRPRDQGVWERSLRAGKNYQGHGEHGDTLEGMRKGIEGQWDYVWHREMNENVDEAIEMLRAQNVFSKVCHTSPAALRKTHGPIVPSKFGTYPMIDL